MYRIIYISNARPGTSRDDVADIVEQAEAANSRKRITGALAFDGLRFCQLLEGQQEAVMTTFARISEDPRHTDVEVLGSDAITERRFPGWSMVEVEHSEFSGIIDGLVG